MLINLIILGLKIRRACYCVYEYKYLCMCLRVCLVKEAIKDTLELLRYAPILHTYMFIFKKLTDNLKLARDEVASKNPCVRRFKESRTIFHMNQLHFMTDIPCRLIEM